MQKRILIVDDEPAIRDMVAFALRKGAFEPLHAGDAREAQAAIADSWGAAQLQNRFYRHAKRGMRALDFQFWLAMRTIGETAARVRSSDSKAIRDYIFGPRFELAGFKGQSFSYRPWDHQLRQPIVLAQPAALVASSPQEGFLHQNNPLDSIGFDKPESQCKFPDAP